MAQRPWAADLLHFWFQHLRPDQWFGRDAVLDAELARRFGPVLAALGNRSASDFLTDAATARAAILLFDQVPRNIHRATPSAFATDARARVIARGAVRRGWDRNLSLHERQFLYMPFMHSEDRADQKFSLRLYARLGNSSILGFARAHALMVARFGRFPHRNAELGRTTTPAEARAIAAGNAW